ncbi:hypothetical protein CJU90_2731 [Yarrowia sp. C11]|nr:hypothetical protein CKK34_4179 [Yarrowia sp. E02]KAG5369276.1 hypothetical protein CJU90_2731 [Yarrowia sp. C11]
MTEELEETISQLKREVLDQQELHLRKDRKILELEDEVKKLKRVLERTERERKAAVESARKTSGRDEPAASSKPASIKPSTGTHKPETKSETKTETRSMPPPRSASSSLTASTSSKAPSEPPSSSSSVSKWTPYERKDPLMDFDDIPGMDDDDAHMEELLNGGRPSTPPPATTQSVIQSTPPRAKSAPQVLGTPEKTRQENLDIMTKVQQDRLQEKKIAEAQKEYDRRTLVIKPVETLVKKEQDHGAYARSIMNKPKSQHDAKEKGLQKRLETKAAEVSGKRSEKKSLLSRFCKEGEEQMVRKAVAADTSTPQDDDVFDPFADNDDIYRTNDNHITHQGTAEDPVALRREADRLKMDLDETSLLYLRERFLTHAEIATMTEDMKVYSVTDCLRAARGGVDIDEPRFAVCGVIVSTQVKMNNFGGGETRKMIQMRIADFHTLKEEWSVSLSCLRDSVDVCLHWRVGAVVMIVNPVLKQFFVDKDSGTRKEETGFSISSGDNNLAFEIGMTADIGRCEGTTRAGEQCKRVIYKRKMDMCVQHAEIRERERRKKDKDGTAPKSRLQTIDGSAKPPTSTRAEFNSVPTLVKGTKITSFKPKGQVQSKSFKRPSEDTLRRQRRENEKVTEGLIKGNPHGAEKIFGKQDESARPLPKHMSQHRHPDDIKVSRYQDDKRMSDSRGYDRDGVQKSKN